MIDLQRVAALVAEEIAKREAEITRQQQAREAVVAEFDEALKALRDNITKTCGLGIWTLTVGDDVHFTSSTTSNEFMDAGHPLALYNWALTEANQFIDNLTEERVVQLWLGEPVKIINVSLRGRPATKTVYAAA